MIATHLQHSLDARLEPPAARWLAGALHAARAGEVEACLAAYTAAPARLGRRPLEPTEAERRALAAAAPGVNVERWTVDDAARALLLRTLADALSADAFAAAARECYERGDAREQQSWLRALALLPAPERFVETAVEACRSNIVPTFEAIACDNPYPERCFPLLHFNQMVLKALFVGLPLARVAGLARRRNAELSRMARDYAAERRAAGRPLPPDLDDAIDDTLREDTAR